MSNAIYGDVEADIELLRRSENLEVEAARFLATVASDDRCRNYGGRTLRHAIRSLETAAADLAKARANLAFWTPVRAEQRSNRKGANERMRRNQRDQAVLKEVRQRQQRRVKK